eukprot:3248958-Rhodomonas_salina.1
MVWTILRQKHSPNGAVLDARTIELQHVGVPASVAKFEECADLVSERVRFLSRPSPRKLDCCVAADYLHAKRALPSHPFPLHAQLAHSLLVLVR